MECEALLDIILFKYPSIVNPTVALDKGVKFPFHRFPRPEAWIIDDKSYLLVPNPAWDSDDACYGLAAWVDGDVTLTIAEGDVSRDVSLAAWVKDKDNITPDDLNDIVYLTGGEGHLGVFKQTLDGVIVVPIGHECHGMVYTSGEEGKFSDVKDVNMIINAINNFQLQVVTGGGLFNINKYMIDAFGKLGADGVVKESVVNNLVEGLKNFIESYEVNNDVPLDLISEKVFEIGHLDDDSLRDVLSGHDSFVQGLYSNLFKRGRISDAKNLFKLSGIKPSESVVQPYYKPLFKKGQISDAYYYLFEWTGIKPPDSVVQPYYTSLLKNGLISDASYLFRLFGVEPSESVVQSAYAYLFKKGRIDEAYDLFRWFEIKPSESIVQSACESLVEKGQISDNIDILSKWSEIKPPDSVVQSAYAYLFKKGRIDEAYDLYDWTEIKPSESIVQSYYKSLFENGRISDVHFLFKWTEIKPDFSFSESIVQSYYKSLFENGRIEDADILSEWTEIKPSELTIQSGYKSLFKNGRVRKACDLYEWTGIKPSQSVVQSAYALLFKSINDWIEYGIDNADILFKWTKIKPSESVVQSGYAYLFEKGWIRGARRLFKWSKIKPSEELMKKYNINF